MTVNAKELAALLEISPAAVSMALNNKPGVSDDTRAKVFALAREKGFDFSKLAGKERFNGTIAFVNYKKHGAVVGDTPFFEKLTEGVASACKENNIAMHSFFIGDEDDIESEIANIKRSGCMGIILLGTEIQKDALRQFKQSDMPIVVVDTYFENINLDFVLINNVQGAFLATDYLIRKRKKQPGYLRSAYPIVNFEERADGFFKAIRKNGMSSSKSVLHYLTPSFDGAYADMKTLIEGGEELADCYFADNDLIAAGAMRALKESGVKIPKNIAVIGFDDIPLCTQIEPALTTVNVPKQFMGRQAVEKLLGLLRKPLTPKTKTEISTTLVERNSVM